MPVSQQYINDATQQVDPGYNTKVQAAKNSLASQLVNLDNSKTGINANYDTQVKTQNINSGRAKNNYSNTMLGRNLGSSSIVGTGLAEQDNINNRVVGNINTARTGALNNVDQQKATLQNNTDAMLTSMSGDRMSQIQQLARQLQQQDWENNYKNQQMDMQKQAQAQQAAYQQAQLGLQRESAAAQQAYYNRQLAQQEAAAQAKQQKAEVDSSGYSNNVQDINKLIGSKQYNAADKKAAINDYINSMQNTNNPDAIKTIQYAKTQLFDLDRQLFKQEQQQKAASAFDRINPYSVQF